MFNFIDHFLTSTFNPFYDILCNFLDCFCWLFRVLDGISYFLSNMLRNFLDSLDNLWSSTTTGTAVSCCDKVAIIELATLVCPIGVPRAVIVAIVEADSGVPAIRSSSFLSCCCT